MIAKGVRVGHHDPKCTAADVDEAIRFLTWADKYTALMLAKALTNSVVKRLVMGCLEGNEDD